MYEVEKGIPIPEASSKSVYPWDEMAIGDSFFVKSNSVDIGAVAQRVKVAARMRALRHNEKFTTRIVGNGIRVWRIA